MRRLLLALALAALTPAAPCWAGWPHKLKDVPGTVIDYEPSPGLFCWALGRAKYVGSPTLARLDNGHYVAAHDLFRRGGGETEQDAGITKVFRSTDRGASWSQVSTVRGAFWSTLFAHRGALYLFGYRKAGGDVVIRRSSDEGRSWTDPRDASSGLLLPGKSGGTPNPPVVHGGRLWIASGVRVWSAPEGADLLQAANWTRSRGLNLDPAWLPGAEHWGEGQVVASPATGVLVLPKITQVPHTALLRFTHPAGAPQFDPAADFVSLPGAEKKFGARYDPVSGKFWVLSNPVLPPHQPDPRWQHVSPQLRPSDQRPALIRNAAAVYSSTDLRTWDLERVFLYDPNVKHVAFQYLNFLIEGQDLIVVSRTAYNVGWRPTPRGHDSNLLTFHRITDFRQRPANPYPPALRAAGGGIVSSLPGHP